MTANQQKENPNITFRHDFLIYSINKKEKTADIIGNELINEVLIIPYSVIHESSEYIITRICEGAFKNSKKIIIVKFSTNSEIRTIEKEAFSGTSIVSITIPLHLKKICESAFAYCSNLQIFKIPDYSELQIIEKNAFFNTQIQQITIPASLIELQNGWCTQMQELTHITVNPNNPRYMTLNDNKLIIGKSSIESENFDQLVFGVRDIEQTTIPKFIKTIRISAFEMCGNLKKIEIQKDSILEKIDDLAFLFSSIQKITLPSCIKQIGKYAFGMCTSLHDIEIPMESELKIIDFCAFSMTPIQNITIPRYTELKEGWCGDAFKLTNVIISPDNPYIKLYDNKLIIGKSSNKLDDFDIILFCVRDAVRVTIPNFIKIIGKYAFNCCNQLQEVEIQSDSLLEVIRSGAFSGSSISNITIPPNLKIIGKYAFQKCKFLQDIVFPMNCKLEVIKTETFSESSIRSIKLSPNIKEIRERAFMSCSDLQKIEIPTDSKLKLIDTNAFSYTKIESFTLPPNLVDLKDDWCFYAENLTKINVCPGNNYFKSYNDEFIIKKSSNEPENYNVLAFCNRNIKTATIPKFIKYIGPYAFSKCNQLQNVQFPTDSELQIIDIKAFSESTIEKISFPINLKIIKNGAFSGCKSLREIEIPNDSKLETIESWAFNNVAIESIAIPSNLIELGDNWCSHVENLNKIIISPKNKRYIYYKDKFILGKSNLENEKYDCLMISRKDIKIAKIPKFIKTISVDAFSNCEKLHTVKIPIDSELQKIDNFAFYGTPIRKITLSKHIKKIGVSAFNGCIFLKTIEIPTNSELQLIDTFALSQTLLTSFYFPPHLTQFNAFSFNRTLKIIEIDENSEIEHFEIFKLIFRSEILIMIPFKTISRF